MFYPKAYWEKIKTYNKKDKLFKLTSQEFQNILKH